MPTAPKVVTIYKTAVTMFEDEGFVYSFQPRAACRLADNLNRRHSHDIIRVRVPDYFDTQVIAGRMSRSTALDVLVKARVGFDGYEILPGDLSA